MKRTKPGDVLQITASIGLVYLHYLEKHGEYGDGVMVCPTPYPEPIAVSSEIFCGGYVIFYPASHAVRLGFASVVGSLPSPGLPTKMRRAGAMSDGRVTTWIIEQGSSEILRHALSVEEQHLPIAEIWNHEFLLERVAEGWRPEMEI